MKIIDKHILLGLLIVSLSTGCKQMVAPLVSSPEDSDSVEWVQFENNTHNFQLEYPKDWNADEYDENGYKGDEEVVSLFFPFAQVLPAIVVSARQINEPDLDLVVEWGEERIKDRYGEYVLGEITYQSLDDQQIAKRTYFTDMTSGLTLQNEDIYIVCGEEGLLFSFIGAREDHANAEKFFSRMQESIQLTCNNE